MTTEPPQEEPLVTTSPWRIVLDIGREPLAVGMPFQWARSGTRMQLVVPCDVRSDGVVVPRSETVSFTGPGGAVERPIRGGPWSVKDNNGNIDGNNNSKELSLSLVFPEYMERGDVWVEAGSTLGLEGIVFTKDELRVRDQEFFRARDVTMRIDNELKDLAWEQGRGGAPSKRWNEETQRWESTRNFDVGSFVTQTQTRLRLWGARAKQGRANNQRPDRNTLSDQGSLPGVEGSVFIQEPGIIKLRKTDGIGSGAVMGTWTARPVRF